MTRGVEHIDDLLEMWAEDAKIDPSNLRNELIKISQYHSKYVSILTHHNLMVKKITAKYTKLRKVKWEYYNGDLNNPDDLNEYGYDPFTKKLTKQDIQLYLDADKELIDILLMKATHQEVVDVCTAIIKELHSRTFQIKSAIDYERFLNGG